MFTLNHSFSVCEDMTIGYQQMKVQQGRTSKRQKYQVIVFLNSDFPEGQIHDGITFISLLSKTFRMTYIIIQFIDILKVRSEHQNRLLVRNHGPMRLGMNRDHVAIVLMYEALCCMVIYPKNHCNHSSCVLDVQEQHDSHC